MENWNGWNLDYCTKQFKLFILENENLFLTSLIDGIEVGEDIKILILILTLWKKR